MVDASMQYLKFIKSCTRFREGLGRVIYLAAVYALYVVAGLTAAGALTIKQPALVLLEAINPLTLSITIHYGLKGIGRRVLMLGANEKYIHEDASEAIHNSLASSGSQWGT